MKTCATCRWWWESDLIWPAPYDAWALCTLAMSEVVVNGPCSTCGREPDEEEQLLPEYREGAVDEEDFGDERPVTTAFAVSWPDHSEPAELLTAPSHSCSMWEAAEKEEGIDGDVQDEG